MKPFKTMGSFCLAASALLLVTSCTKEIDEQFAKGQNDAEQLAAAVGGRCGQFVGMRLSKGDGRFWYESVNNDQNFTGSDFTTDVTLMKVTSYANGMKPTATSTTPVYVTPGENLGVFSNGDKPGSQEEGRINEGEVLRMEIGSGFPTGVKFYGFDLNLNASKSCQGVIKMFDGAVLVATYTFTGIGKMAKNFPATYRTPDGLFFTSIEFSTTQGAFRINGAQGSLNPLNQPDARFYVIDLPNQAYFNTDLKNPNNFPFLTALIDGVPALAPAEFQLRSLLAEGQAGSGNFNLGTREWLKFQALASGPNVGLVYQSSRLSIRTTAMGTDVIPYESGSINPGEILTITAGSSLPFKFFRTFEFREAHPNGTPAGTGNKLSVLLWNGNNIVGGGLSTGTNNAYNAFFTQVDFDRITVTGTGSGASIGRPSPVAMRVTKGCPPTP